MRIVHISDTHNKHRELEAWLPEGDVIVHSGDFTFAGAEEEAFDFINWFCDLPYRHKIFIAGNHDDCLDGADGIEGLPEDVHYLCHSSVVIDGVKFYGLPMFMSEVMNDKYVERMEVIPVDLDVLVSHQPPFEVLDFSNQIHYGSRQLRICVQHIEPRLHLFGHIHGANGIVRIGPTVYANSSVVDERYFLKFKPRSIEI